MRTTLINGRLILPGGIGETGYVVIEDGKIAAVEKGEPAGPLSGEVIDAHSLYISPGFIDLHTHGAGGADFMDGTVEAYLTVAETHARYGTTALLPTTLTCPDEELFHMFDVYTEAKARNTKGAHFLGIHLEGPYFAYEQRGAQDPKYLRAPDEREYKEVLSKTNRIRRWSFAVELDGAERFLRTLQDHGIVSSLAHSNATTEQVFRAYENGMRALTHFYSGMSGVRRIDAFRVGGAIEAGYLLDDLFVEVIADGCHLPKELLQLIYKVKGADRICLVTDSMRGAGMPDGHYVLGNKNTGLDTIVEDGVAKLPDRCSFAGSVATSDRLVRTFRNLTSAPLYEVVRMASLTPAKLLGISHQTGSIANGKKADLIIFDEHISVSFVMVNGRPLIA